MRRSAGDDGRSDSVHRRLRDTRRQHAREGGIVARVENDGRCVLSRELGDFVGDIL
jgi:hypothetical protein